MHTTASAPGGLLARNASSNAPGAGAAVSGQHVTWTPSSRRTAVATARRRSVNSSSPNRIVRGTTCDAELVRHLEGRSQALSVTMCTWGMGSPCSM